MRRRFVGHFKMFWARQAPLMCGITQINGFLYLQHKVGSDWFIVKTWTGSVKDWTLDISGEATGLSSGTYRTRFVTYVYEGSESEEVIYISKEVVYNKK